MRKEKREKEKRRGKQIKERRKKKRKRKKETSCQKFFSPLRCEIADEVRPPFISLYIFFLDLQFLTRSEKRKSVLS